MRRGLASIGTGLLVLGAGVAGLIATSSSASAAGEPGSGFLSLSLIAEAGGERFIVTQADSGQPDGSIEQEVPFAQVNLDTNSGHALASMAWPGALAGNLGSLIVLSGGPAQASALNTPVRAEARTGSGDATDKNETPGGSMTASAVKTKVTADADIGGLKNATTGKAGTTTVSTAAEITGATSAYSTAESTTENVDAGALTIGSVHSTAKVTTNGSVSKASGRTNVSDAKVAGIPVTIDEDGVHANGQGTALTPASAIVNTALEQSGTEVFLTAPHKTATPNGVSYDSGSLIISFHDGAEFLVIGGAKAIAGSSKATIYRPPPPPPTTTGTTGGTTGNPTTGGTTTTTGTTGGTGGTYVPPGISSGATTGATTGGPASNPQPQLPGPTFQAAAFAVPDAGVSPWWVVLALLGAGLIAFGLKRLPDRVLEQTGTPCPLGDE